jgi:hypothetical protein
MSQVPRRDGGVSMKENVIAGFRFGMTRPSCQNAASGRFPWDMIRCGDAAAWLRQPWVRLTPTAQRPVSLSPSAVEPA